MKTEAIEYSDGDTALEGYLAAPDGAGPRPAVVVCHAYAGRDAFATAKAEALAELGYAGFALDVYGKGVLGSDKDESRKLMAPFLADRAALRARLAAGVAAARARPEVDGDRVAAIGFCFGGLCALDLARTGADLRGVVAFHGLLVPAAGLDNAAITAKVLALHGHDDPMVPPEQVLAFEKEMTEAGADWQVHVYGGTMHAFTNPEADDPGFGTVYNEAADRRSWATMKAFLSECLA